jgi:ribosomal protein L7/L12
MASFRNTGGGYRMENAEGQQIHFATREALQSMLDMAQDLLAEELAAEKKRAGQLAVLRGRVCIGYTTRLQKVAVVREMTKCGLKEAVQIVDALLEAGSLR